VKLLYFAPLVAIRLNPPAPAMLPAIPALEVLRLASIHDVPRLALVATSGFYYSPVFSWERAYHHTYPQDTFQWYEKMFADIIRDPEYIALVIEDKF
jgi:hypothetical protein